jgi:hypothetical protein
MLSLFQWGGIDHKGATENWGRGQFAGKPVGAVASDLLAVEEYLTSDSGGVKLVILDDSERFSRDLQIFDEILDSGLAAVAVVSAEDTKEAALLSERGFVFWEWTKEDLSDPLSGVGSYEKTDGETVNGLSRPFSSLQRTLRNFRDSTINETNCSDEHVHYRLSQVLSFGCSHPRFHRRVPFCLVLSIR